MSQSGFVAGTLVHTDQGLVPIEQLKVGDMVLSMPEEGVGEKAYKRVVKTFKSPTKQKIMSPIEGIYCTDNHPFWVTKGRGRSDGTWVRADQLNQTDRLYQLTEPAFGYLERPRYHAWMRDPYGIGGLYLIATDQDGIAIFLDGNSGDWIGDQNVGMVDFRAGYPQQILTNDKESYLGRHCYISDLPEDTLEYKILKYLSENNNGEPIDVSNMDTDKNRLKNALSNLKKEKPIRRAKRLSDWVIMSVHQD